DGGGSISDGAFAETKEVIGGYYLIEAADLDDALRIAAEVPAPFGGGEGRPGIPARPATRAPRWVPWSRPPGAPPPPARGGGWSPRRPGSPATWTPPRTAPRTPTPARCRCGRSTGCPAGPGRG